jgi:hypothetical protein
MGKHVLANEMDMLYMTSVAPPYAVVLRDADVGMNGC